MLFKGKLRKLKMDLHTHLKLEHCLWVTLKIRNPTGSVN